MRCALVEACEKVLIDWRLLQDDYLKCSGRLLRLVLRLVPICVSHSWQAAIRGGSTTNESKGAKSNFTRKQEEVVVLRKANKKHNTDDTSRLARHLLGEQYMGVVMEVPGGCN